MKPQKRQLTADETLALNLLEDALSRDGIIWKPATWAALDTVRAALEMPRLEPDKSD